MRNSIIFSALQILALTLAVLTCWSVHAPKPVLAALALSGVLAVVAGLASRFGRVRSVEALWYAVAFCSLCLAAGIIFHRADYELWTVENALAGWLLTVALGFTADPVREPKSRQRWLALTAAWAHISSFAWLGAAHVADHRPGFYAGLVVWLILCFATKRGFQLPAWGIQTANTLILLIVILPLVSFVSAPLEYFDPPTSMAEKPYSYENARKNPAKFARWIRHNREQGLHFFGTVMEPVTSKLLPGAKATFFENTVHINSRGFRGDELPEIKSDAYRIVALGESTTFGITLESHDRPWPERLQTLIEERLHPTRPVQVINAGIPGWSLKDNLPRLSQEILDVEPDMILSYHGYNGFQYVYDGMPPIRGNPAPRYRPRPVKLLADAEYAWATRQYRKRHDVKREPRRTHMNSPLETEYATLYRQLIAFAHTNQLRLALATYSMAVTDQSPGDVIDFYQRTFPRVKWQIKANAIHAFIVEELARQDPDIVLVDTRPALDGKHVVFTDLVHLTPEGKQQIAELFFEAIRETLERDLNLPTAPLTGPVADGSRNRAEAD